MCCTLVGINKKLGILHILSVSNVSYPACNTHAPYHIVIRGLSGSTIFSHII